MSITIESNDLDPARCSIRQRVGAAANAALWSLWAVGQWCLGLLLFLGSLPIMAILAMIIRKDSWGPALFRQLRIGRNRRKRIDARYRLRPDRRKHDLGGRPFIFFKFRTMAVDASERFPELYRYEYSANQIKTLRFKLIDDPRLSRFGVWLRTTTLDELPNLINLLKGDIYLVGPRPDIPEMVRYYSAEQREKLSVKPGITGIAQTQGRGFLTFQETLECDLDYVRRRSVWLDLRIVIRTVRKVLGRDGAF
jgi:lipopolysaccharide/colanic/teichoic acid biosynthesis glycosyltransferase